MGEERSGRLEDNNVLSSLEIDTIGEILNISMGSAATAISNMLDKQVVISTPTVEVRQFRAMDYAALEPAMLVKINYVEGISGSNVMIFRQHDMQVILNLLMGNTDPPTDDFVFDELSMSAACEVMNQMMGASATALSEFLGRPINISTPEASVVAADSSSYSDAVNAKEGDEIVAVSFRLTITDVMDSSFASILSCSLAKDIVGQVMGQQEKDMGSIQPIVNEPEPAVEQPTVPSSAPAAPASPSPAAQQQVQPTPSQPEQVPQPPLQQQAPYMPPQNPAAAAQGQPGMPPAYPDPAYGQQPPYPGYPPYYGYPGYPPMPYPPYQQAPYGVPAEAGGAQPQVLKQSEINIQKTQFPQFTSQGAVVPNSNGNMDLLMGVSLDVSVEIGKTKRKIREILEFGQGTVIELNKQAGAPVDIVVNGRLLARGDVVVIDDNFGVRITEILGTKELMESLREDAL